jgi:Tfp pilus assembly protein PilF
MVNLDTSVLSPVSRAHARIVALIVSFGAAIGVADGASSRECAPCHRAIYDSYSQTPMAESSGRVGSGLIRESFDNATFDHASTGFRYRVVPNRAGYSVEFGKADGTLRGSKALAYYVGSGATARSYLLEADGFLFEAPAAYYTGSRKWSLAPNYETYAYPYLTRPAMPGCLTCHASFLAAVPGTQNRYGTPPFAEGGVACERCHGPGEAHIRKMREPRAASGAGILNPARLAPALRDSVCAQCHLTGDVRVMRPGRDWQSFQPGQRLSDSMTVFVRADASPGMKVTSHVEKLAQSACKRGSGDRLWCGTCHDPHTVPKASERAAWFRQKCLTCHDAAACKETKAARTARQDDCTSCHMPKSPVLDAQHVVYTDHSIPRRLRVGAAPASPSADLVVFAGARAESRDLALAYGILASRTQTAADRARALTALEQAAHDAPGDVEVMVYLAELYRNGGQDERAIPLYRSAMEIDPTQVTAPVGLGGILMERGQYAEAIRLWQNALAKNAGLELVRINMALAQWRSGDLQAAERSLAKAVELSPGFATPVELLQKLRQQMRRKP